MRAKSLLSGTEIEVTQSCLILCNHMDCNLPGSSVHGIAQARVLEWVAIPFSRESSPPGIKPRSPTLQADASPSEPPEPNLLSGITALIKELQRDTQPLPSHKETAGAN